MRPQAKKSKQTCHPGKQRRARHPEMPRRPHRQNTLIEDDSPTRREAPITRKTRIANPQALQAIPSPKNGNPDPKAATNPRELTRRRLPLEHLIAAFAGGAPKRAVRAYGKPLLSAGEQGAIGVMVAIGRHQLPAPFAPLLVGETT